MAYDRGQAGFSTSGGARNVVNGMNPMTPGGMSPKGTHIPTLGWALIFVVVALIAYHAFFKKGRR